MEQPVGGGSKIAGRIGAAAIDDEDFMGPLFANERSVSARQAASFKVGMMIETRIALVLRRSPHHHHILMIADAANVVFEDVEVLLHLRRVYSSVWKVPR